MQFEPRGSEIVSAHVLHPAVVSTLVWAGLVSLWFLWILCTARAALVLPAQELRLSTPVEFAGLSLGNLVLAVWLACSVSGARRSPPGLRRGHLAGVALALGLVALLEVGGWIAVGPLGHG